MSLLDRILGSPLSSGSEDKNKVGVFAGIPMLGLDALSSAAYGPEAALTILLPLGAIGLKYIGPIVGIILALLAIVYLSYRQTIEAYPHGGGSYTVASQNLGRPLGLLAAAALLLDYILNAAVGISAGVGALVSAIPSLLPHTLACCLSILVLIALVNLRGTRESGNTFALPTYLFVASLSVVILLGIAKSIVSHGHPHPLAVPPTLPVSAAAAGPWLLMRSFASGCTAMTGVEAVSNGVSAFLNPAVKYAQKTLTAIVVILAGMLAGIGYLVHTYQIGATDPAKAGYQSVLSMLVAAVVGRSMFYYVTIASVLAVLALSANTSFAGFPRLCRLLALDEFLPHGFSTRGRRLVFSQGIVILTLLAGALLVAFGGITDRLIPLFAIGAFLAFTLSQAGMVVHWRRSTHPGKHLHSIVNGVGAVSTGIALAVILVAKFKEGAWITVLLIPTCVYLFRSVKNHYKLVANEIRCPRQIDLADLQPPIVVVPVKGWNTVAERAIRFALQISTEVVAVHVAAEDSDTRSLKADWAKYVEQPTMGSGHLPPDLIIIPSPYRRLIDPLLAYINKLKDDKPDRQIAVIIPELVESKWYQYLLHKQRATGLKAALLLSGEERVVVVNVPWYVTIPKERSLAGEKHDK